MAWTDCGWTGPDGVTDRDGERIPNVQDLDIHTVEALLEFSTGTLGARAREKRLSARQPKKTPDPRAITSCLCPLRWAPGGCYFSRR